MSDLIKRLRALASRDTAMSEFGPDEHIAGIAADEIERLKTEAIEERFNAAEQVHEDELARYHSEIYEEDLITPQELEALIKFSEAKFEAVAVSCGYHPLINEDN